LLLKQTFDIKKHSFISFSFLTRWPPQCSCVVIESSFDPGERLQAPGSLWFGLALHIIFKLKKSNEIIIRGLKRTNIFLLGYIVKKLNEMKECFFMRNCTVVAILAGERNCRTPFWKRTIQ
jgi:hypothetical protein